METKNAFEVLGSITKEEQLKNLNEGIIENTFVLENVEPFPGYHGKNLPEQTCPEYVFLMTKDKVSGETVQRISSRIKKYFKTPFDAASGMVYVHNSEYPFIRIKGLTSYEMIADLQQCYIDEGISFAKRKKIDAKGIIKVRKFFGLEKIEDGIYKDIDDPAMTYIEIPDCLKWKQFEKYTFSIKNNLTDKNFDAALGAMYRKEGILEVIRIYSKEWTSEHIKHIKDMYLEIIGKYGAR